MNTKKPHWRNCKHPRTPANSVQSGRSWETCKMCKAARGKNRVRPQPKPKRVRTRPAVQRLVYFGLEYQMQMAEAKLEYEAWLRRQAEVGKGGRPKGRRSDFRADPLADLMGAA